MTNIYLQHGAEMPGAETTIAKTTGTETTGAETTGAETTDAEDISARTTTVGTTSSGTTSAEMWRSLYRFYQPCFGLPVWSVGGSEANIQPNCITVIYNHPIL